MPPLGIAQRMGVAVAALAALGGAPAGPTRTLTAWAEPAAGPPIEAVSLTLGPERSLKSALLATGAPVDQVNALLFALSEQVDVLRPRATAHCDLRLQRLGGQAASVLDLTYRDPDRTVKAQRLPDGGFGVIDPAPTGGPRPAENNLSSEAPVVVQGPMEQVLYGLGAGDRVPPLVLYRAVRLFAHRLDLARDLALGDRVRLIYARGPGGSVGLQDEQLLYAEIDHRGRLNRFYQDPDDAPGAFVDEMGQALNRYLLRTPLDNPRVTSGFGFRLHPLLGYTRMHRGVDFGAPIGTPILAAADGEVEAARFAGGFGRFVRLRHAGGWATGYGHLSAWAEGLHQGMNVRQGQVIGFVGNSGLASGPHLHYEVYRQGIAVDPGAVLAASTEPARPASPHFQAQKRLVEGWLAAASRTQIATDARRGVF